MPLMQHGCIGTGGEADVSRKRNYLISGAGVMHKPSAWYLRSERVRAMLKWRGS